MEEYGKMLLTKGTENSDISEKDLVFQDSKKFWVGNEKIQISQINPYNLKEPLDRKDGIKKVYGQKKGYCFICFWYFRYV